MSQTDDYRYLLLDLVERVRADAKAASGGDLFDQGRQMAYFELLEHVRTRADLVGLAAADVGMDGFDPGVLVGIDSARQAA
jgi:hypothetical protein